MDRIRQIEATSAQLGAVSVLEQLGVHSGRLSYNRARTVYGKWFVEAAKAGKVKPVHVGDGRNGTKTYRVCDILGARLRDEEAAFIIDKNINK